LTNYTSFFWVFVLAAMALLVIELLIGEKKKMAATTNGGAQKPRAVKNRVNETLSKMATVLMLSLCSISHAVAQKENEMVRKGNDAYKQQKFEEAGKQYETALKQNSTNSTATFNLGNTRFKTGNYEEAAKQYDALAGSKTNKQLQAKSLYNKGVSMVKQQKLTEAIDAFKQSLKAGPNDAQTRENLQKALNEQQQQQQQKDKEDDKKEDKKKDEKKDKKDPEKQDKKDKQPPQPKPKISKENAEQKLQALRQEEKKLQERLNQKHKSNTRQPEKDW
ncbi:MAG: tetratricopeptide repeat protein, partial [Chitinophagaceae bacterium]|nr:tetratricopeptide repeat protein [Chitinophagaceae bacterium]